MKQPSAIEIRNPQDGGLRRVSALPDSVKPAQTLVVGPSHPDTRLDSFLRAKLPDVSRGTFQRLIAEGAILVNGARAKPAHRPRVGEVIVIRWPMAQTAEAQPEDMALEVLYEDADLLVVNKPAGLVVHPAAGHAEHTLVNALLHHCQGQLSGIGGVARPGIVHRLDKETSGCLVVAKNDATHLALSKQFAGREVEKIYHAIVCGELPGDRGVIDAPIARHPTQRKRMAVRVRLGRAARTEYRVLERLRGAAWVEVRLHTGRTHQIRVHFQHLGHPVVGDLVYGQRQNRRLEAATGFLPRRQLLHSFRLGFQHPRTGKRLFAEAPNPPDFAEALKRLVGPS